MQLFYIWLLHFCSIPENAFYRIAGFENQYRIVTNHPIYTPNYNTSLSPQHDTNDSISSGPAFRLVQGPPSEKLNLLWLVSCPSALWLVIPTWTAKIRQRFRTAPPLTKTASLSILPYKFKPREYWTRGSCRTFARTDIARHIKVVMLLFLVKSGFR